MPQNRSLPPASSLADFKSDYLRPIRLARLQPSDRICAIHHFTYTHTDRPVRIEQCKHIFGLECLLEWFENADTCPLCRTVLFTREDENPRCYDVADDETDFSDSETDGSDDESDPPNSQTEQHGESRQPVLRISVITNIDLHAFQFSMYIDTIELETHLITEVNGHQMAVELDFLFERWVGRRVVERGAPRPGCYILTPIMELSPQSLWRNDIPQARTAWDLEAVESYRSLVREAVEKGNNGRADNVTGLAFGCVDS
jgi:hypothetical protein